MAPALSTWFAVLLLAFAPGLARNGGPSDAGPAVATAPAAFPEEGMWTFDNLPLKELKEKYGFEPTKEWLDHVRLGSVRFDTGGSGSFVSPHGLVMTNHHVALSTVQKLSLGEKDYVKNGFSSREFGSEVGGPELTLRQLIEIVDVTKEVVEGTSHLTSGHEIATARGQLISSLAQAHTNAAAHIVCDPLALYNGAEYKLYVYHLYEDVRLVFAPEQQTAFYGGDPDNFTYPRYDLDCAFFRVYEDGKPIDSSRCYFKWSKKGAAEDELIFVSGHPGSTQRLLTYAQLELMRDVLMPAQVKGLRAQVEHMAKEMAADPRKKVTLRDSYFGASNSLKAFEGQLGGLRDAEMMAKKKAAEDELIAKSGDPEVAAAFKTLSEAYGAARKAGPRSRFMTLPGLVARPPSKPTDFQRLVAAAKAGEKEVPAGKYELSTTAQTRLEAALANVKANLAPDDPFVVAVLGGREPADAAKALLESKAFDSAFRAELVKGGAAAVAQTKDPLIAAVSVAQSAMDEIAGIQQTLQDVEGKANDVISQARFKVYGKSLCPDATFTLRLSYGTVKGYEAGTTMVPYKTTFYGLYERNTDFENKPPFDLPKRWLDGKAKLDLTTPLNFVCTADIIGGNSGSPVLNKNAEIVGLIFDGNIESLPGAYWYDGRINRAVSVHSAGMVEAISRIYGEADLVSELTVPGFKPEIRDRPAPESKRAKPKKG